MRTDLSHLPPSSPEEIRAMTQRAGLDLPEELMQQFVAAWPAFEAMVRRMATSKPAALCHIMTILSTSKNEIIVQISMR